ncbi:MAG: hypothetical protein JXQ99_08400 [Hyphomicrobiaceae bacterium]
MSRSLLSHAARTRPQHRHKLPIVDRQKWANTAVAGLRQLDHVHACCTDIAIIKPLTDALEKTQLSQ